MLSGPRRPPALLALGLAALLLGPASAIAARRPAAMFSYCGFGTGPADSAIEPGGGGDTIVVGNAGPAYHFVFDSSSPVTLAEHDHVIFETFRPDELRLVRVDDHLAICHAVNQYEMAIERHYCASTALSATDTPNNQIEEITFVAAREVWLADVLYAAWLRNPDALPPMMDGSSPGSATSREGWRVRPFSEVLPDAARPATSCSD